MNLNKDNLASIVGKEIELPAADVFSLPEKVLQFGTGVLLRGLPDYFIDKANKKGLFNGRIVVVKSTSQGGSDEFEKQDALYTHCIRGYEDETIIDSYILNASISRVLAANESWKEIVACAANPAMEIIISNTTEAGIVLTDDNIHASPPSSFPGKLLAFLYERYKIFNGDNNRGLVILPTELITDNGKKLKEIVLELARRNKLEDAFISWLLEANDFCNTLVDRIVPGKLSDKDRAAVEQVLGYTDELMIMSEVYSLWAIETSNERVKSKLSFTAIDSGVIVAADINKYKELKLRLLNGSHTFTCGLAILSGFTTVKEAMADDKFYAFISDLMLNEIVPTVVAGDITENEARLFAQHVLNRYRNPFIEHKWLSITLQYTMKMRSRNVDTINRYYQRKNNVPQCMAKGFAAYLLFMHSIAGENGNYTGNINGHEYVINDQHAKDLHLKWQQFEGVTFVQNVLADEILWGSSLPAIPGFAEAVYSNMISLQSAKELMIAG